MKPAVPSSPAEMRAYIIERLTGETGEPDRVTDAARAIVEKLLPDVRQTLKQQLTLELEMEITGVELVRIADAKPDSDGHAMAVIVSGVGPDAVVMTMDAEAIALAVSALFGGDPGIAVAPIRRQLSPTETVVASRIFEQFATALARTGDGHFELLAPSPKAMSGEELRKHPLKDGAGARVRISLAGSAASGTIELTMPQRLLLKGSAAASPNASGPADVWRQRFGEEVMRSGVELQATMPLARMTLGDVASLQVGQLIEFQTDAQSQAKLSARQKTLFVCEFGKLGQNYTVRVRHPFDAGQDLMEGLVAGR